MMTHFEVWGGKYGEGRMLVERSGDKYDFYWGFFRLRARLP